MNRFRAFQVFVCLLALAWQAKIYSAAVYHPMTAGSNILSTSTLRACTTFSIISATSNCNAALFAFEDTEGLRIGSVFKADGDAIDNGRKLIFEPVDEEFLRSLFEIDNFNSFTLNSDLIFLTDYFQVSYHPYFLMADILIYNPAFSGATVNLANQSSIDLMTGSRIRLKSFDLGWGARAKYREIDYSDSSFNLVEFGSSDPSELIQFENETGLVGDVGLFLKNRWSGLSFAGQIKNIGSDYKLDEVKLDSSEKLVPLMQFETYSSASIGWEVEGTVGAFAFELYFPYESYFENLYTQHITLSSLYTLKYMTLTAAVSEYHQSAGMVFNTKYTEIGISYHLEKDLGDYSNYRKKSVYVGATFTL